MTGIKAVLVSRHELLPSQKAAIQKAGIEIVEKTAMLPEPGSQEWKQLIQELRQKGIEAVVTTALPPHFLAALTKEKFRIFVLKMRPVALVESEEAARKLVAEAPEKRVAIPAALGEKKSFRVMEFAALVEVKIIIEEKPIVTV